MAEEHTPMIRKEWLIFCGVLFVSVMAVLWFAVLG